MQKVESGSFERTQESVDKNYDVYLHKVKVL